MSNRTAGGAIQNALSEQVLEALVSISCLQVQQQVPLKDHTRFAIGGEADIYIETAAPEAFAAALSFCRRQDLPHYILGEGSNVVVSDRGIRGVVLRYVARDLQAQGRRIDSAAGAVLQDLVDFAIARGLQGLETLTGIPGAVGAAVYGNAGAYGHSISERIETVRFFDGEAVREFTNAECRFDYRESIFKRHKDWMIFRVWLALDPADPAELGRIADDILKQRTAKFPPTMKCAGSIFKNLQFKELPASVAAAIPERVVREGKVAAAFFLEQVGAKGMEQGGIRVADYHANLIYNAGGGTAAELRALIGELKGRVRERFGVEIEEEIQYVGEFAAPDAG